MDARPCSSCEQDCQLRVLVVDDDLSLRGIHVELIKGWGYTPYVAEGTGEALIADAVRQANARRCHLALVDMRLRDNTDKNDRSGLELVAQLKPTESIILSGFDDRRAAVAALRTYRALNFVGKEDHPEDLRLAIESAAQQLHLCQHHARISWPRGLSSRQINTMLFPSQPELPAGQADELVGKLFPHASEVVLTAIDNDNRASAGISAPRRQSRVFQVTVDSEGALRIVKLARVDKIRTEAANYNTYVKDELPGNFRAEKVGEAQLWDMGAIAYRQLGNVGNTLPGIPETLTSYYRAAPDAAAVLQPLQHFFYDQNWGGWYRRDVTVLPMSLFEVYDKSWKGRLRRRLAQWKSHERLRSYPQLAAELPNPTRWIADYHEEARQVTQHRSAVTHGDLHADNLFVDAQHAWPIDFERTGPGPILRDFIELTQDLLTRVAPFAADDLPVCYEIALALCAPLRPDDPMSATAAIQGHPEAQKVFTVVSELQKLARQHTRYNDQREYLWGLLLNCLLVYTLIEDQPDNPRRVRTLLLASAICARLERWSGGRT